MKAMMFLHDWKTLLLKTKVWNLTFSIISEILFEGVNHFHFYKSSGWYVLVSRYKYVALKRT